MITALDHIAIAVADLDAAAANYERFLGRKPWRGQYPGAAHAWFQLPNMALNLVSPQGEGPLYAETKSWLDTHGEGLWSIAFTVEGLDAYIAQAGRRGVKANPAQVLPSAGAAGDRRTWRLTDVDPATTAGVEVVLVETAKAPFPISEATLSEDAAVQGLDHVVINTPNPERALALYGARLGLDFRLERSNPEWGSRLMFFRAGATVVEIGSSLRGAPMPESPDRLSGLAWRVTDPDAAQARIASEGFDVSEVRVGRKPGTKVFTIRSGIASAPSLMITQGVED